MAKLSLLIIREVAGAGVAAAVEEFELVVAPVTAPSGADTVSVPGVETVPRFRFPSIWIRLMLLVALRLTVPVDAMFMASGDDGVPTVVPAWSVRLAAEIAGAP